MAHHAALTGSWTKFHGHNRIGSFQTGKAEGIRIYSAHHMEATGVLASRDDLVDDGLIPTNDLTVNAIEIQGVTYNVDVTYDQALIAQRNFDNLLQKISDVVTVVSVDLKAARGETVTSLTVEFASLFLGATAANTFGTQLVEDGAFAWQVDIVVEQKGAFINTPGSVGFVRGEPSLPTVGNNNGSSLVDIANHLNGTVQYATQAVASLGDLETMVDADTTGAFVDGINILTGVAGAFAGAFGDQTSIITQEDSAFATSQTVVLELFVAPDLQS